MFVPLKRMPLNPNGKIDKPALPFPDTAAAATSESRLGGTETVSATEKSVQAIWAAILPNASSPLSLDESFFDLGGHSILATRLIFEIRKIFVVDAPLSLVFDHPTIREQAAEIDALRNSDLGLAETKSTVTNDAKHLTVPNSSVSAKRPTSAIEYAKDFENLLPRLRSKYDDLPTSFATQPLTVFLTGATGFLGAFILRDLLSRQSRVAKVICHVRASDETKGLERLKDGAIDRAVWDENWVSASRLEVVVGDLSKEKFGLDEKTWNRLASECDVIVHNGALVILPSLADRVPTETILGPLGVSV